MEKAHFTKEKATMLATLYGRAIDSSSQKPILNDPTARDAVRKIDYDFRTLGMTRFFALGVVLRAKPIDDWAAEFLHANPAAVVVHLGCGMDSRVFRLNPPASVSWYDVDYPDVIALRERIYPQRKNYHMIGSSVTDFAWLDQVPGDRPALVIAEGLTMYLLQDDGEELIRRLVQKFPNGEMIFDICSRFGLKIQRFNRMIRRTKATLHWGVDNPRELEKFGLTLISALDASVFVRPDLFTKASPASRLQLTLMTRVKPLREVGHIARFRF